MSFIQLPDHLKRVIEQHVAAGDAASEAAFVAEAVRRHADKLRTGGSADEPEPSGAALDHLRSELTALIDEFDRNRASPTAQSVPRREGSSQIARRG